MIGLQAAILLLLGVCCSAGDIPDCESCVYHNNIGFVNSSHCNVYFMCIKNPYIEGSEQTYRFQIFCCAPGLSWDQEHLTCVRDSYCIGDTLKCPEPPSTTDLPCKYYPGPTNRTFYTPGYELLECSYDTVWSQEDCTCVFGPGAFNREPCTKLLDFDFTDNSTDSDSCYNFAKGEPYGEPSFVNEALCLNGRDQFLQVGFLNNWFAWNPQARTFTVCLYVVPAVEGQTAALLSLNCDMVDPQTGASGSVLDIVLEGGLLKLFVGDAIVGPIDGMDPSMHEFTQVCVTFDNGVYKTYWNADPHATTDVGVSFPQNTHSAATLGFKDDTYGAFAGCIDDFVFYNEAKSETFIKNNYIARPLLP